MRFTNPQVICQNERYGTMTFYVVAGEERHYLFTTPYFSMPIFREYGSGCALRDVFRNTHRERQSRIRAHILRNVRSLELDLGLELLERRRRRIRTRIGKGRVSGPDWYEAA